jgi:ABC-type transport system involved in cytochrome c biogenesis permease subunit
MSAAERAMGRLTARRGERVLGILTLIAMATSLVLSLVVSPPDVEQGQVIRLMYVHVPAAWLAYLSFGVVLLGSVAYLITRKVRWDRLAAASAEVGVLFTFLTLVVGSIWAKPVWGVWWTWDPRLTTTAVMFLVYVGYLACVVSRQPDQARPVVGRGRHRRVRQRPARPPLGPAVARRAPAPLRGSSAFRTSCRAWPPRSSSPSAPSPSCTCT